MLENLWHLISGPQKNSENTLSGEKNNVQSTEIFQYRQNLRWNHKNSSLSTKPSESIYFPSLQPELPHITAAVEGAFQKNTAFRTRTGHYSFMLLSKCSNKQHNFQLPYREVRCSAAWGQAVNAVHFKKSSTNMFHCTMWHLGVSFGFSAFLLNKKCFILVTAVLPSACFWFYPCLSFTRLLQTSPFEFQLQS